jgi:alkane 1-monooxygenase
MGLSTTGFLISHELFHKNGWLNKAIGTLHQIKYLYMHFTVEHVQGHHKRVSTPEDPASAPKGMTLGEFVPRSIIGSFKSALQINPRFVMLTIVGDLIFLGIIWAIFGARGVFLAILLALGSINMLETINYV